MTRDASYPSSDKQDQQDQQQGRPLPLALRQRILDALHNGDRPTHVARRFMVSRATVYRLLEVEATTGHVLPRPSGGYRRSLLDRDLIVYLATKAVHHPKLTAQELLEQAVKEKRVPQGFISVSSVYHALHKAGVRYHKLLAVDEATKTDPLIALERRCFAFHQQNDPKFDYNKLLFMDESYFRLNEQSKHGWAAEGIKTRIGKPKGIGQRVGVIVTIGPPNILHYQIVLPQREYRVYDTYSVWDFEGEESGKNITSTLDEEGQTLTTDQIKRASISFLRDVLRYWGVKGTTSEGKSIDRDTAVQRVLHLKHQGRVGLPKSGRVERGGKKLGPINTALDIAVYFRQQFKSFAEQGGIMPDLKHRTLVLDNASIHGAPKTNQPDVRSFLHDEVVEELGMKGVLFTPPRSPDKNPVELVLAFVKKYVRKEAPNSGFTESALVAAIKRAFDKLAQKMAPDDTSILVSWARKCGYSTKIKSNLKAQSLCGRSKPIVPKKSPTCNSHERELTKSDRLICATKRGTIIKEKRRGELHWRNTSRGKETLKTKNIYLWNTTKPHKQQQTQGRKKGTLPHRFPGYGVSKTTQWRVMQPKSFQSAIVAGDNYAIHAIVSERPNKKKHNNDYLVHWTDNTQSWLNEDDLTAGAQQVKAQWRALKKRRQDLQKTRERLQRTQRTRARKQSKGARMHRVQRLLQYDRRKRAYLVRWDSPWDSKKYDSWEPEGNITEAAIAAYWTTS